MITAANSPLVARVHASPNFEPRKGTAAPDILLLHYTGMQSADAAIEWLARPASRLSSHYVIDTDGTITQMVAEDMRAWHAGVAVWAGETDINSRSIGFEIQNPGHADGYHDFPDPQMDAVIALARDILARHPIPPERVLAHSDVAPDRKIDPGEKFDWARLAVAGVGHWVKSVPATPDDPGDGRDVRSTRIAEAQQRLARYGYGVPQNGILDAPTEIVLSAFQRHFRTDRVDGRLDGSTLATLDALLAALPAAAKASA